MDEINSYEIPEAYDEGGKKKNSKTLIMVS